MEVIPMAEKHHLMVGLKVKRVVLPNNTPEKRLSKKAVEEVVEGHEKSKSFSEFDDVFYMNCDASSKSGLNKTKKGLELPRFRNY